MPPHLVTDFGTTGIYHSGSTTATTGNLTMQNNIVVNESVPAGTGITAAIRQNNANTANFNAASNRNMLFAGTPGLANVIYTDGTNTHTTLAQYQAGFTPREENSFQEKPSLMELQVHSLSL